MKVPAVMKLWLLYQHHRAQCLRKKVADSSQTLSSHFCALSLGLRVADAVVLLLVLVLQGSTLDFYLILHNEGKSGWYFWFLGDFVVLIAFMAAIGVAHRHYRLTKPPGSPSSNHRATVLRSSCPPGVLPLAYMAWLMYASMLVAKVVLLFKLDVAQTLRDNSTFGPHLLKLLLALAAVVFLLLVESHRGADCTASQQSYVNYLCSSTAFELFDSITFLGLLFPDASRLVLPYFLENAILALSCVNFLLPALALYKLSISDFGLHPRPLGLSLLYRGLRLVLVDIPYLTIRIRLWTSVDKEVSLFLMKNVLGVAVAVRTALPDLRAWWQLVQEERRKNRSAEDKEGSWELAIVLKNGGRNHDRLAEATMIHDHFDEVNLNDDAKPRL